MNVSSLFLAISDTDTTIYTNSALDLPQVGIIQIEDEQIRYEFVSDSSFVRCTRGYNSTTAVAHAKTTPIDFIGEVPASNEASYDILTIINKLNLLNAKLDFSGDNSDGIVSFDGNGFKISGVNKVVGFDGSGSIGNRDSASLDFELDNSLFLSSVNLLLEMNPNDNTINFKYGANTLGSFDSNAAAGETHFLLRDGDSGSLQRVKVTANDAVIGVTGRVLFVDDI